MRSTRTLSVAGIAIGLLAITPAVAAAQDGATITVARDGSGDHDTIASAVEAASAGDTILVAPGTYTEGISLSHDVHLVGDGDRNDVILLPTTEQAEAGAFLWGQERIPATIHIGKGSPTIERMTLDFPLHMGVSVLVEGGSPTFTDVVLGGDEVLLLAGEPTFRDAEITSYFAVRGASPTVEDSELTGHASVDGPGRTIIRRSTLHDGTSASADATGAYEDNHLIGVQLAVDSGSDMLVKGNLVEGVQDGAGIAVVHPGSSAEVIGNTVRDSIIGIAVDSDEPGSSVIGNTISDVDIGLHIDSDSPVPVEDNHIEGITRIGLVLQGDGAQISGNDICGEGSAITIRSGSPSIGSNEVCEALEP